LTLSQLAERVAIPSHHLSQLLNERLGLSFFDYVNRLRVEEVKRLLLDPKKDGQSILDLAFEAGFSSKSSFNSIFKRSTGYSPSAYRNLSPFSSIPQESRTSNPMGEDDATNISA
jgi:AraC-like DNA-binding protein